MPGALDPSEETDYLPRQASVVSVQDRLATEHFDRIRVVKVDVEGFETEVLRGLDRTLSAEAPLGLVVEISPDWSLESLARFLGLFCRTHGLVPWRVQNEYAVDAYFPTRLQPPVRVELIPEERADLVLVRGSIARMFDDRYTTPR